MGRKQPDGFLASFSPNFCAKLVQTRFANILCKTCFASTQITFHFSHCTNIAAQSLLNKMQSCADSITSAFSWFTSSPLPPSFSTSSRPGRSWWPSSSLISYQNPHHYFAKRSLAQFSLTLIHSPSPSLQLSIQSDARVRFVNAQLSLYLQKCNNWAIGWKHNLKLRRAMQNHAKRRKNTENNITKDAFIPGTTFIQYSIIHLYCDTIFI